MLKTITIGTTPVEMAANAATPFRYHALFHEDPLVEIQKINEGKTDMMAAIPTISRLAFVMAMQAAKKDMNKLTEAAFYEWLEPFEMMDIAQASGEIIGVYIYQTKGTATPKKE